MAEAHEEKQATESQSQGCGTRGPVQYKPTDHIIIRSVKPQYLEAVQTMQCLLSDNE